jgi:hypothetical protein
MQAGTRQDLRIKKKRGRSIEAYKIVDTPRVVKNRRRRYGFGEGRHASVQKDSKGDLPRSSRRARLM